MFSFFKTFNSKPYKDMTKRLNVRWFNLNNNIWRGAKLFDVGLAFKVHVIDNDIWDEERNHFRVFDSAFFRMFILRNEYYQELGGQTYWRRDIWNNEAVDYKQYELLNRYTLLMPRHNGERWDIVPVSHWGEAKTLKRAQLLMAHVLDLSLDLERAPKKIEIREVLDEIV